MANIFTGNRILPSGSQAADITTTPTTRYHYTNHPLSPYQPPAITTPTTLCVRYTNQQNHFFDFQHCFAFLSDRPHIGNKFAVETVKEVLLSALCRHNKSFPVRFSKLLTKLAELRTLNDTFAKFLTYSFSSSFSPCESDQDSFSGSCDDEESSSVSLHMIANRKVAVA